MHFPISNGVMLTAASLGQLCKAFLREAASKHLRLPPTPSQEDSGRLSPASVSWAKHLKGALIKATDVFIILTPQ